MIDLTVLLSSYTIAAIEKADNLEKAWFKENDPTKAMALRGEFEDAARAVYTSASMDVHLCKKIEAKRRSAA